VPLASYYGMIGFFLNAFAVDMPDGVDPATLFPAGARPPGVEKP
jgi:hypothetical protein